MLDDKTKLLLQRHVDMKGRKLVTRELGISSTSLSQVLNDKYPASTHAIQDKINKIYSHNGTVDCPVVGEITPQSCADNFERAQKRIPAGNPRTMRLYVACRKCDFR